MTTQELRQKFLQFFQTKNHAIIPSASLLPENDATVLFTTAGMHPLVPFLLGEKHPAGNKLTDCQKCLRTGDIDDVGDNRHLTFFEMLGNWSLGDYFKQEAISWSFEFLTGHLHIDPSKLYVTVFVGNDEAPMDNESVKFWQENFQKVGIDAQVSKKGVWENEQTRIFALGKDDNWWGLASGGPCGPCSEMFVDTEPEKPFAQNLTHDQLVKSGRFVEIWNDVFMEYKRNEDGSLEKLAQKNVDTGMGVERTTAILNGFAEVFDIAEFQEIFKKIEELSGKKYIENQKAFRVIADHVRAATFILADDKAIEPSNVGEGYVLRRLIRRAVRFGHALEIKENFLNKISEVIIFQLENIYPELLKNKKFIFTELKKEEEKFAMTLQNGLKRFILKATLEEYLNKSVFSGIEAFNLFQTFGFPIEMTIELAKERNLSVDVNEFEAEMKKHQDLSRAGAEQKFKGGLADNSEETTKLHTATHLLQAALRKVLGEHVHQKGSNITPERLRFDFVHQEKMTTEQIQQVENLVNDWIKQDVEVVCEELPYDDAVKRGAMGLFTDKYGQIVKVYTIGQISCEMCGGPHVQHTAELGQFKIQKEEASSAGVRRIKAVLINRPTDQLIN